MKIPFMPDNTEERLRQEQNNREYGMLREQLNHSNAEQLKDEILLQQQNEREDLLRWQQDLDDEEEQLIHDLRNEIYIDGKGWIPDGPPLMNKRGIKKVLSDIRPFLSRNMINCNYTEDRVLDMLKRSSHNLATDLCANHRLYDLEFSNISMVLRWIKNIKMSGPHRAINGWTKNKDSTISKRVENINDNPYLSAQPKKKLFGIF